MALQEPLAPDNATATDNTMETTCCQPWRKGKALENLCCEAWKKLHKKLEAKERTLFFHNLKLDRQGGLDDIDISRDHFKGKFGRYASAVAVIFIVFYNICFICYTNYWAILGTGYTRLDHGNQTAIKTTHKANTQANHGYLVSAWITRCGCDFVTGLFPPSSPVGHVLIDGCAELAHHPVALLGTMELLVLGFLVLVICSRIFRAWTQKDYVKYHNIAKVCWFDLPDLAAVSALKMLQYVQPQQLSYDINDILFHRAGGTPLLQLWRSLVFKMFMLVLGMDYFLTKIRIGQQFINKTGDEVGFWDIMGAVILLNQILGVVQIGKTLKRRLYRFVFAGEDGVETADETAQQNVWEAMIAEKLFKTNEANDGEFYGTIKAILIMLSWSDDDFQKCVLQDVPEDQLNAWHLE